MKKKIKIEHRCHSTFADYEEYLSNQNITVKDIEGPWKGAAPTGLLERCRGSWDTPLSELSDLMVATFLNQNIALKNMIIEAKRRLKESTPDDTELYDDQLKEALKKKDQSQN